MVESLLILLGAGGTAFFLIRAAQMRSSYKALSHLEAKRVELEAAREREDRVPLRLRVRQWILALGYDGDVFPFAAAMAFLYLTLSVALVALNVPSPLAYVAALPGSVAVVVSIAKWITSNKRKKFNVQLVEMLELVAGQIEGGTGAQRALSVVVPSMSEPLRSEMSRVLDSQLATKKLDAAMRELHERYPSRALALFISTLEINEAQGHSIAPAIRQAAGLLNADFQLRSEAVAEVSQQRGEFFIVLGVLGAVAGYMVMSGDATRLDAYTSPIGIIAIGAALANVIWGVWRMLTLLRKLQGDEPL